MKRRLYALIHLEVHVHVHDSLFTNLIQFIIFQKHKGTEGVIQIENPNLVKAKNIKAKEADVSVLQPEASMTLLLVAKYHKIACHTGDSIKFPRLFLHCLFYVVIQMALPSYFQSGKVKWSSLRALKSSLHVDTKYCHTYLQLTKLARFSLERQLNSRGVRGTCLISACAIFLFVKCDGYSMFSVLHSVCVPYLAANARALLLCLP